MSKRPFSERAAPVVFAASIAALGVLYGTVSSWWGWFPAPQIGLAHRTYLDLKNNWRNDIGLEPTRHIVAPDDSGETPDPERGFVAHQPDRAEGGYTLVAGLNTDPEGTFHVVRLYDAEGEEVHHWPVAYGEIDSQSKPQTLISTLPHLPHAPRHRSQRGGVHRLYRVNNHTGVLIFRQVAPHRLNIRLRQHQDPVIQRVQTLRPQLRLMKGLLTRDIQHRSLLRSHPKRHLKHQSRFSDPRITSNQHQRPVNHPSTQYPVELPKPRTHPRFRVRLVLRNRRGRRSANI